MENKLHELTQKLYEEGLSKGRNEAGSLVEQAKQEAAKIVEEAQAKSAEILRKAEAAAEDLKKHTQTEVVLASRQVVSALKQEIEKLILAKHITPAVNENFSQTPFVKDVIMEIVKNWNGADLRISLPAATSEAFVKELEKSLQATLSQGAEITLGDGVKSGFRIGPKDGSYYISFGADDFDALFKSFLRPQVADLLYK